MDIVYKRTSRVSLNSWRIGVMKNSMFISIKNLMRISSHLTGWLISKETFNQLINHNCSPTITNCIRLVPGDGPKN